MEDGRLLALREASFDIVYDDGREDWSGLPPELLEMIGSKLTEGAHLHNAAMVCKSWKANIATGLTSMELDMHSDPSLWRAKMEKLASLIRHLRCCVIHVNTHITDELLHQNLALVQQLKGVSELKLHLRDGCDLPPAAAAAIGSMRHLTSLSIIGGGLSREAAAQLLAGLAAGSAAAAAGTLPTAAASAADGASPGGAGLRSLTLLPAVHHGLGDEEMPVLAGCASLEVLEFRAHRLTSAGLSSLSRGLPRLTRLAISSLDSDSGYELACLERLAALAELDLALDQAPTGAASRQALCAVKPGRSLSLSFRWTERAQGLLADYGNRLANLTHLDVGACRVGSESLFEAVAQLTGLRELRMAVYSNADHCIPCHLSRLTALAALQRFHLEKRRAYFPEARRFGESSIAVPVTAEGLRALAGRWSRLRSLRLALSRKDYSPEGLTVLASFTGLRELGILVERYPGQQQQQQQQPPTASTSTNTSFTTATAAAGQQQQDAAPSAASSGGSGSAGGLGRLSRRGLELPPQLDLGCLPAGLQSLELNNLLLELSDLEAMAAAAAVVPPPPSAAAAAAAAAAPPPMPPGLALGLGSPAFGVATPPAAAAASPAFLPPPAAQPPPLPLSQLTSLDIEACVVRPPLLAEIARRCGPCLRHLRLAAVVGLSDAALAGCLVQLRSLRSLTVSALGNRAGGSGGAVGLPSAPAAAAAGVGVGRPHLPRPRPCRPGPPHQPAPPVPLLHRQDGGAGAGEHSGAAGRSALLPCGHGVVGWTTGPPVTSGICMQARALLPLCFALI
ncbi:hypothetical protein Agub_g4579 [Astrephomene gubernaculifera]|uniref:F-box domain-containing protein n=1 Tax=Astrephomene gubernaculifera TaxID=47775 RepID=A0AAD3DMV1_9CHLO|nr:hypothetical protein Agub_g4579 [Astrephomene gubernaculifera]